MIFKKRLPFLLVCLLSISWSRPTIKQAIGEHCGSTDCQLRRGGVLSCSVSGKLAYFKVCCKTCCCSVTALYTQYLSVLSPLTRILAFFPQWISCYFGQSLSHRMACVLHRLAVHLQALKTWTGLVPVFPLGLELLFFTWVVNKEW